MARLYIFALVVSMIAFAAAARDMQLPTTEASLVSGSEEQRKLLTDNCNGVWWNDAWGGDCTNSFWKTVGNTRYCPLGCDQSKGHYCYRLVQNGGSPSFKCMKPCACKASNGWKDYGNWDCTTRSVCSSP